MLTEALQVVHGVFEHLALGLGNQPAAGHLVQLVLVCEAFLRNRAFHIVSDRRREETGALVVEAQLAAPLPLPGLGLGAQKP